jgi:hypothetical protein
MTPKKENWQQTLKNLEEKNFKKFATTFALRHSAE